MKATMAEPKLEVDEIDAATEVLVSGSLRAGPLTDSFERAFADYFGVQHAYACSSGTAALHLAYLSVLSPGDEVLVPALTFIASASAAVLAGGTPVFCDVDPQTFLIDLDDAETRVTDRTRAICAVSLFGQPFDDDGLRAFAARHDLVIIGDAAQSLGSTWDGAHAGASAALTAHSFYPTKNLFVGEGGMVTTNDADLDDVGRLLRAHGQRPKYHHSLIGLNYRLTDVEAAIGLAQLPKIDARSERRRSIAGIYDSAFADLEGVATPFVPKRAHHTFHQYTLTLDPEVVGGRDDFAKSLSSAGIGSQVNYPLGLHAQGAFASVEGHQVARLPVVERLCGTVLSIPVHHNLDDSQVAAVVEAVCTAATRMGD